MTRGLPYSLAVHALGLLLLVLYGNFVPAPAVTATRTIPFRLTHSLPPGRTAAPTPAARPPQEAPPPDPVKDVPAANTAPKELPKAKPKPQKEPEQRPAAAAGAQQAPAQAGTAGLLDGMRGDTGVGGTDADFPFAWYLTQVEGLIAGNWNPRQLGFGSKAVVHCAVHFLIARNGAVSGATVAAASGVGVYDREALRAVQTTRLPPLPPQYRGGSLGVTFIFNLEPQP